jgi:hypothetical protein
VVRWEGAGARNGAGWINQTQDRDKWRAVVNVATNPEFHKTREISSLQEKQFAAEEGSSCIELVITGMFYGLCRFFSMLTIYFLVRFRVDYNREMLATTAFGIFLSSSRV